MHERIQRGEGRKPRGIGSGGRFGTAHKGMSDVPITPSTAEGCETNEIMRRAEVL
jgi:hypothetical protein